MEIKKDLYVEIKIPLEELFKKFKIEFDYGIDGVYYDDVTDELIINMSEEE